MASSVVTQVLHNGPGGYAIIKCSFVFNTADLAATVIADPATLGVDQSMSTPPGRLAIAEMAFAIQTPVAVVLQWGAGGAPITDAFVASEANQLCFKEGAVITDNAGAGNNQLLAASSGTPATGTLYGALWLKLQKVTGP